jgi:phosphatidate phosphatase APP1
MSIWKEKLTRLVNEVDTLSDRVRFKIKKRLDIFDPVMIMPYYSYGTSKELNVFGRVLENKGIERAQDDDSVWDNIRNMYLRLESDEIAGVKLKLHFQGKDYETETNDEGYFNAVIIPEKPLGGKLWEEIEVEIISAPVPVSGKVSATARVMVPDANAEYGVISDIDDTVIESFATDKLRMMKTVFLKNARSRLPFEGVSAFYRALETGADGKGHNPMFYVSSSPWNLFDFLTDFMDHHGIPAGPLLLKDNGIDNDKLFSKGHLAHKYTQIEKILNTYPGLPFILIGDSGQADPLIYHEVVKSFPGRISAIYIRDVKLPEKGKVVIDLAKEMEITKVPMILVENTVKAAEHALQNGYIPASAMEGIKVARAVDNSLVTDAIPKDSPETVKEEVKEEMEDVAEKAEVHNPITSTDPGVSEGKVAPPENGPGNKK